MFSDLDTLFLNASETTAAVTNNDPVGVWADKSGNSNDVVQTGSNRPLLKTNVLNNLPIIRRVDANTEYLEGPGVLASNQQDLCIFIVGFTDDNYLFWTSHGEYTDTYDAQSISESGTLQEYNNVNRLNRFGNNDDHKVFTMQRDITHRTNNWRINGHECYGHSNPSNSSNRVPGPASLLHTRQRVDLSNDVIIGALPTGLLSGNYDIAEVLIYDRAIPDSMLQIEKYLLEKWGVPWANQHQGEGF